MTGTDKWLSGVKGGEGVTRTASTGVFGVMASLCILVVVLEDSIHVLKVIELYTPKSVLVFVNLKTDAL